MPAKIDRSTARPPFGLPEMLVAVHTSRLSCREAEKVPIFTPVQESSGESKLIGLHSDGNAPFVAGMSATRELSAVCSWDAELRRSNVAYGKFEWQSLCERSPIGLAHASYLSKQGPRNTPDATAPQRGITDRRSSGASNYWEPQTCQCVASASFSSDAALSDIRITLGPIDVRVAICKHLGILEISGTSPASDDLEELPSERAPHQGHNWLAGFL